MLKTHSWQTTSLVMALIVIVGLVLPALAILGSAQVAADGVKPCTNLTIRGDYGIQRQGTRPTPPPSSVTESVVGIVLRTYDGYGNFEQVDNIKGTVTGIVPDRPWIQLGCLIYVRLKSHRSGKEVSPG